MMIIIEVQYDAVTGSVPVTCSKCRIYLFLQFGNLVV